MANTSAPLSEVAVASMAASMLDEFRLVDLDQDDPMSRFFAREFGQVRDEVIQLYPWHAFSKRKQLTPETEAPEFGWDYAYNYPSDCIRLLPLRQDGLLNGNDIPHEIEGRQILCDVPTVLPVRYLFRQTNMAKWPPLTARVLAARLARYASTRVTGKSSYFQKCDQEFKMALTEATAADTLERGTAEFYGDGNDAFSVRGLTRY
jgi:hypothetical protein